MAAGYYHTCALSTAHKVKCFGRNNGGQLGYGDTNNRGDEANQMSDNLLEIELGTNFIPMQMTAGYYHTCALSTANKVKCITPVPYQQPCWGMNAYGYHKVKCFGRNNGGQLGYGDTNNRGGEANEMSDNLLGIDLGTNFLPIQMAAGLGTNFIPMQMTAEYYHTCALSTANKVKCWGYNLFGQLGYGDT
eukprot:942141_1